MLEQKIQEVYGNTNKSDITVMELNGCEATSLDGLTDDYENLAQLSLANNHLKTLKSFPTLKTLTSLILKGNSLEGSLDHLAQCDQLKVLDLSDNNFTSVEQLEPLKQCTALETLNLAGCPIAGTEGYQTAVFDALPHLKCIDGTERTTVTASHAEGENGTHTNGNGKAAVNGEGDGTTEEAGVDQLLRDDLEDDDEEYNPEGEEEEDEDIEEEEDEEGEDEEGDYEEEEGAGAEPRGVKRKHEDEDPLAHADESANGTH